MGTFAVVMALVYAGTAKLLLDRKATTRTELCLMIGVALAFITLAIPIQFKTNWITVCLGDRRTGYPLGGNRNKSARLRAMAHGVFAPALTQTRPLGHAFRLSPAIHPRLNKYFLSLLFVTACLFAAALLYQRFGERKHIMQGCFNW